MPQSTPDLDSSSFENDVGFDEGMDCELTNEIAENFSPNVSAKRNSGFLSIGGFKLYTQDISDDENEEYNEDSSDEESSMLSENNDSECTSHSDSDIDEDVAEDYLEGVGGSHNILDAKWLPKPDMNKSDDDNSSSNIGIDKGIPI
ncbi:hypothetical protein VNO80_21695 [Phaseolus coccineus]|uniref:Uncharacterized protein n=1 Tax=Phaseolus coccineus TaxID=3886 RepID=A0AAN9M8J0_PHACN